MTSSLSLHESVDRKEFVSLGRNLDIGDHPLEITANQGSRDGVNIFLITRWRGTFSCGRGVDLDLNPIACRSRRSRVVRASDERVVSLAVNHQPAACLGAVSAVGDRDTLS